MAEEDFPYGEKMKVLDIVGRLSEFDEEDPVYAAEPTIYAAEPWTEDSDAMVLPQQDGVLVPAEAAKEGLAYFLEINLAIEITEALVASAERKAKRFRYLRTRYLLCHL
ncbi:hypothetical protein [Mesorhizobium sp. M7A.F.Ca.US.010.02.1.1]|uniref:hypothetical protein n=1 Tax=unclassified Mesorhizobium TaxID=325217 RepID=UPI000FD28507|nr:hypothetical protein [Mesorhizobium sp. M7A.F.Ca.US.010.02.1.1]RUW90496.1 hypothetical protein EOA19_20290 [Mesorhizobium sp. M7A.F.Ca.US.010.02.1.1]